MNQMLSNDVPMVDSSVLAISAHAAKTVDNVLQTGIDAKIAWTDMDTDTTLVANSDVKIATQKATKAYIDDKQRKAWVSGVLRVGSFPYFSTAVTSGGIVTFYITDSGLIGGGPVYSSIYVDSITISPYGSAALYQVSGITVAGDRKSISATVNQVTSVLVGLLQVTGASNGISCNLLVLGD